MLIFIKQLLFCHEEEKEEVVVLKMSTYCRTGLSAWLCTLKNEKMINSNPVLFGTQIRLFYEYVQLITVNLQLEWLV